MVLRGAPLVTCRTGGRVVLAWLLLLVAAQDHVEAERAERRLELAGIGRPVAGDRTQARVQREYSPESRRVKYLGLTRQILHVWPRKPHDSHPRDMLHIVRGVSPAGLRAREAATTGG